MAVGCSPTTAARHVWYDRFDEPDTRESSGTDRMWRLNMVAFSLGTLPQIIKVFAMHGVPFTQALAAILLATFIVPEILRITAGTAHAVELTPLPIIQEVKLQFNSVQNVAAMIAHVLQVTFWIWTISMALPSTLFSEDAWSWRSHNHQPSMPSTFIVTFPLNLVCGALIEILGVLVIEGVGKLVNWIGGVPAKIHTRAFNAFTYWNFNIIGCISTVLAIERSSGEAVWINVRLVLGLSLCCVLSYLFVDMSLGKSSAVEITASVIRLVVVTVILPACLFPVHILYRILFMGILSKHPRRLFGLQGSVNEFLILMFLVFNFSTLFIYYSSIYSSQGTYKPTWTDKFG